jgi:alcohol dehydrogenase class IV
VHEGRNIEARSAMMMASMMGAIAFQKGLGLTHSCAHALSTAADLHHGLANGVMIDHALKFNVPAVADRFRVLAQAAELSNPGPESFFNWLGKLKSDIGIPHKLSALGLDKKLIPRLTEIAIADACHQNNPRPCRAQDFAQIFVEAF